MDDYAVSCAVLTEFDRRFRADLDDSFTRFVSCSDAGFAKDRAARREVGTCDELHEFGNIRFGVVNKVDRRVYSFGDVVRRNVACHTDCDTARSVDEKFGDLRRHYFGFLQAAVVVVAHIDGVFVEIRHDLARDLSHSRFGVPHCSRAVAVDRAEVALTVNERVAHREILRHSDKRLVNCLIAVRMVFTDDVADDPGRLFVSRVVGVSKLLHREEHSAVNRFQTVSDIGQRPVGDDAHRIVDERRFHGVFDRDIFDFAVYQFVHCHCFLR